VHIFAPLYSFLFLSLPDLEFGLRSHCQRLIVKGTPLSGAHLLLASERIAVRTYYPCDLQELQEQEEEQKKRQTKARHGTAEESSGADCEDDFDGLSGFVSSFQLPLVLIIVPPTNNGRVQIESIAQQLDDIDSHFHRAQRLSVRHQQEAEATFSTENGNNNGSNNNNSNNIIGSTRKSRVFLLPDTQSAIQTLIAVADAVAPERKASKRALFRRLETKFFLPSSPYSDVDAAPASASNGAATKAASAAAATHVARGLCEIARTFELPPGEEHILMSELGDLQTIATADDSLLATIPIDRRSRKVLHCFFGSLVGKEGEEIETRLPRLSMPRPPLLQQQQHNPNSHSITSIATQLFPQPTSSLPLSFPTHESPCDRSLAPSTHLFQVHNQVPQVQPPQQHLLDPSTMDEFWMEPRDALAASTASFYAGNDEIPEINNAFHIHDNTANNIALLPPPVAMETNQIVGRDRPLGMHHRYSQFSEMRLPASSSLRAGNRIDSYGTQGGQPHHGDFRFHEQHVPQSHRNPSVRYQYQDQVVEPIFRNPYAQSQPLGFRNEMNRPTNSHQYQSPPRVPFSSSRQQEHQHRQQHGYQKQYFSHPKRFRR
jgi:hypothetical protein